MHFLSDAIAEIEGLLEVNRDFCKKQMAEKASPALPTNCAVVPMLIRRGGGAFLQGGGFFRLTIWGICIGIENAPPANGLTARGD